MTCCLARTALLGLSFMATALVACSNPADPSPADSADPEGSVPSHSLPSATVTTVWESLIASVAPSHGWQVSPCGNPCHETASDEPSYPDYRRLVR
ncbi:hypothetical protein [Halomicronema hongdechloris]|uniref:hypothetical protein n=1 Tax=Halomicronema hongdechloris TaxID=1209493 RepID=UPI0009B96728|nr:hypothetical protein [Halomicronema hongdechloris]